MLVFEYLLSFILYVHNSIVQIRYFSMILLQDFLVIVWIFAGIAFIVLVIFILIELGSLKPNTVLAIAFEYLKTRLAKMRNENKSNTLTCESELFSTSPPQNSENIYEIFKQKDIEFKLQCLQSQSNQKNLNEEAIEKSSKFTDLLESMTINNKEDVDSVVNDVVESIVNKVISDDKAVES